MIKPAQLCPFHNDIKNILAFSSHVCGEGVHTCMCMCEHRCTQLCVCVWKQEVAVFLYCFLVFETESLTTPGAHCFGQTVHWVSQPVGLTCCPLLAPGYRCELLSSAFTPVPEIWIQVLKSVQQALCPLGPSLQPPMFLSVSLKL